MSVETSVPKELKVYTQSISRLKEIKKVAYNCGIPEQNSFQRAMRRGVAFPGITKLSIPMVAELFENYNAMVPHFEVETESTTHVLDIDFENLTENQQHAYRIVQDGIKRQDEDLRNGEEQQILAAGVDQDFFGKM